MDKDRFHNVSAVIPVYNNEQYIASAIDSLLNQTIPLGEIIVVDDGSTDRTYSIVQRLEESHSCVKLLRQPCNGGASAARNRGIHAASGEWILFLDADDVAEPRLVEQHWINWSECDEEFPDVWVLVHSAYRQMDEQGRIFGDIHRFKQVRPEEILGYEFIRNYVYMSGTLVKRSMIVQAGAFDTTLKYAEDWDLFLRLAALGGFVYVDEPLFNVRRHPGNASRHVEDMLSGERKVLEKHSLPAIEEAIHRRRLPEQRNQADFAAMLFRLGHWSYAYERLRKQLRENEDLPLARFYIGLYYIHEGRFAQAESFFEQARRLGFENGAVLNNLGAVLLLLGRGKEAEVYLREALSQIPGYMDAAHNIELINRAGALAHDEVKFTWRELRAQLIQYAK